MNKAEHAKDSKETALSSAFDWVSSLVTALLVVALVFLFLFRMVFVSGKSMTNTLQDGDRLLMASCFYTIHRGDIVVIHRVDEEPLIKRVIAVAGDVIDIDEKSGQVILNGETLEEPYTRDGITPVFNFSGPYEVPEGYVFAMGDNRCESKDSRILGAFSTREVVGVVQFRLSPLDKVGRVGGQVTA